MITFAAVTVHHFRFVDFFGLDIRRRCRFNFAFIQDLEKKFVKSSISFSREIYSYLLKIESGFFHVVQCVMEIFVAGLADGLFRLSLGQTDKVLGQGHVLLVILVEALNLGHKLNKLLQVLKLIFAQLQLIVTRLEFTYFKSNLGLNLRNISLLQCEN